MKVCSHNHEEIVHKERICPLCEATKQIAHLEKEHATLLEEYSNLEDLYEDLVSLVNTHHPELLL